MAILDNYLPCDRYQGQPSADNYPSFLSWYNEDDNHWYFGVVTNTGRVVLRSEAYTSEAGRNNGIESVVRNRDIEERYAIEHDESDGQWYIVLRAGNRQEIARSCGYGSEADARAGIEACFSTYTEREASSREGIIDNYLPCERYEAAPDLTAYPGFRGWQDEESGQWFFAVVTDSGRVVLRSEAYTTEAARNNGVESVIRNRDMNERYRIVQDETDGNWYVVLRAGNNQEIARSCAYESEDAAKAGISMCFSTYTERKARKTVSADEYDNYLPCESYASAPPSEKYPGFNTWHNEADDHYYFAVMTPGGHVALRSEGYTTEAARNNGIESVIRNRDIEDRYRVVKDETDGNWYVTLRAGNNQEIARSCPFDSEGAALAGIAMGFSTYSDVQAEAKLKRAPVVIEDYLPCEAYAGKNATVKYDGFTTFRDETSGLYYFAMVDEKGKVILKSEGYTTSDSRDNGIESVIRNRDIKERWVQSKDDEGYYMSLRAGNRLEIARTCHHDSEASLLGWWMPFSTAWAWGRKGELVEMKGEPSSFESFTIEGTAADTPVKVEIEEVAAPVAIPEPELLVEPEPPAVEPIAIAGAAAAAAALVDIEVPKAEEKPEYTPQWKKKEEKTVVYTKPVEEKVVPPPPVTQYTEATATGGSDWWKWLLGLLLLGLLAWLLMRGCDGCNKKAPETPAVTAPATPAPAVTTPAPPTPPPAPVCNCNAQTDPVFNMSNCTNPKSLSRLGTNPEFGNSHDLTPTQFYEKLARRHKDNVVDKAFLERMFKAMGYANGFADAKADMFTAVEIPAGTVGNIGYSKQHKTLCARLDTQGKDLLAFRIKSANGCDLHFMKTCGNHFFFCPR